MGCFLSMVASAYFGVYLFVVGLFVDLWVTLVWVGVLSVLEQALMFCFVGVMLFGWEVFADLRVACF